MKPRLVRAAGWIDEKSRALGRALERGGERSMTALGAFSRNPTLLIALTTVVLFAVARLPTETFYSEFGVRPEDVGLNSVQVMLQGSTILLGFSILLCLACVAAFFSLFWIASLVAVSGTAPLGRVLKTMLRLSLAPVLLLTVVLAPWLLINVASGQSDEVREGKGISPGLYPWRAEPVNVTWRGHAGKSLPGCTQLFYLGEANNRVALYDAARNTTYRIHTEDIEIEFPLDCPSRSPERDSNS
jgi:hypothetical protein